MTDPQRIGTYEVLERIGHGGFGVVYRAREASTGTIVAIKTCSVASDELLRRFLREAEIAGSLHHRNITRVLDFGVEGGDAHLVQEYLAGEDLAQKIGRRERLPLAAKLDILRQIASGLAYAHSRGVVHRDVKPGNIRVLPSGLVKIMDFGIAKLTSSGTHLTQKGMTLGTVNYLSPEQLQGGSLDRRSDLFSFGVVAFELLTYRRPFEGKDLSELMTRIVYTAPPAMQEHWPGCPPELESLVARCLEKDPADRFADFEVVLGEIEKAASSRERTASAPAEPADEHPADPTAAGEDSGPPSSAETRPVTVPISLQGTGPSPADEPAVAGEPSPPEGADEGLRGVVRSPAPPAPSEHDDTTPPAAVPEQSASASSPVEPIAVPRVPRTPAGHAGSASRAGARRRTVVGLGAAVVMMVVVLGTIWWLTAGSVRRSNEAVEAASHRPAAAANAPEEGWLTVVAVPWGELRRVTAEDGEVVDLPADRSTPIALVLPAGRYRVEISGPHRAAARSCAVEIRSAATASCQVAFRRIDVDDYFAAAGWWE